MTKTNSISRFRINEISDDTVRYLLVYASTSKTWKGAKEVMCEDSMWHTCWMSDEYPNQYGARNAITFVFGV